MFPYKRFQNRVCLSVPSPTVAIDTSMEMCLRILQHGNPKFIFYFQKRSKLNFDLYFDLMPKSGNHHSFVNISPKLVIDSSMERSSRVLQHGNPNIWCFFFQKSSKLNFDLCCIAEITLVCQYQSYISNWYINGKVFTSTTTWKPNNFFFSN